MSFSSSNRFPRGSNLTGRFGSAPFRPRWWRILLIGAIAGGAATVVAAAAEDPVRVKLATLVPKGSSSHQALMVMGQQWRDGPGGGIALSLFTDGSMGFDGDMIRRMRTGQLHAALLTVAGLADVEPDAAVLAEIPLAFDSLEEAAWVRHRLAPRLEEQIAGRGLVVLGWCDLGWWRIFSRQPLRVPEDLRNQRFNVGTGRPARLALIRALGMQPEETAPPDTLTGLQSDRITITPAPPGYALSAQLDGVAPYMLELNWAPLVNGLVIGQKSWNGLTPAQQDAVRSSAAAACAAITLHARQEMVEAVTAMRNRGLQVQSIDRESREAWAKFANEARLQARGTLVRGEAFDEAMALIAEFRAGAGATKQTPP
jgi:TRAP-type C4-dicarboxylate transport system substrate-binding protein